MLDFEALDGWRDDNHVEALQSFLRTCDLIDQPDWKPICAVAADVPQDDASARSFFELFFKPMIVGTPPALFTGYFEPELDGSPTRTGRFKYPIYRRPPELREGMVYHTREAIEGGAMPDAGWNSPGSTTRSMSTSCKSGLGPHPHDRWHGDPRRLCRGKNGHAYRSVGQEMVRRGTHTLDQVSAPGNRQLCPQQSRRGGRTCSTPTRPTSSSARSAR
jgi:membrane-bound lytic murein transglycosylase A